MKIVFPLLERFLTRGCVEHQASGLGCAADYRARFVDLYAPVAGTIFIFSEPQGGSWIRITDPQGRKWEMAHLSARSVQTGDWVKAGERIGKTGNTGAITTGPHLHLQVIQNGHRLDPVPLLANAPFPNMPDNYDNKIIRCQEDPFKGSLAYVKAGTGKKQLITRENAGLANITFIDRSDDSQPLGPQIVGVNLQVWNSFVTVPDRTWF